MSIGGILAASSLGDGKDSAHLDCFVAAEAEAVEAVAEADGVVAEADVVVVVVVVVKVADVALAAVLGGAGTEGKLALVTVGVGFVFDCKSFLIRSSLAFFGFVVVGVAGAEAELTAGVVVAGVGVADPELEPFFMLALCSKDRVLNENGKNSTFLLIFGVVDEK